MYSVSITRSKNTSMGFTLIELLVVISIVAILASFSLPLFQRSMMSARRVKGIANLRTAGAAIIAYAGENNSVLPGPCGLAIIPTYKSTSKKDGDLAGFIAPYLGLPDVSAPNASSKYVLIPALVSPGIAAANPKLLDPNSRIPHYIQSDMLKGLNENGNMGTVRPFGYAGTGGQEPVRLARLGDFTSITTGKPISSVEAWLISDVDKQITDAQAKESGWFASLPAKPVYGSTRLRIYADGHAAAAGLNEP